MRAAPPSAAAPPGKRCTSRPATQPAAAIRRAASRCPATIPPESPRLASVRLGEGHPLRAVLPAHHAAPLLVDRPGPGGPVITGLGDAADRHLERVLDHRLAGPVA